MTRTIEAAETDAFAAAVVQTMLAQVEDSDLELMDKLVDWEDFRSTLESIWDWTVADGRRGRPSWDAVLMFKVLVYGKYEGNLADAKLERDLLANVTAQRFVGLGIGQGPDAKTIHKYRQALAESGRVDELFQRLTEQLAAHGYEPGLETLLDASLVAAPVQRKLVKKPRLAEVTETEPEPTEPVAETEPEVPPEEVNPAQVRQQDKDSGWTLSRTGWTHGYKRHVAVDRKHKLIVSGCVSAANVHDSQMAMGVMEKVPKPTKVLADRGYDSNKVRSELERLGHEPQIAVRQRRGSTETKRAHRQRVTTNQKIARKRVRVEHVFGTIKHNMGCRLHRGIGLARAKSELTLENVVYNMRRLVSLEVKMSG